MPGTDSSRATQLLESKLPQNAYGTNPLALEVRTGRLTDPENAKAVEATVSQLKKTPHVISAVSPLSQQGARLLSEGKQIAYIPVTLDIGPSSLTQEQAQAVSDAAAPARSAGIRAAIGGYALFMIAKPATESSEIVGLAAAVLILLLAFGTAT